MGAQVETARPPVVAAKTNGACEAPGGTPFNNSSTQKYQRDPAAPPYGALDLGTNNCRLLLALPGRDGLEIRDAFSRIVRLGEGASKTGVLSEDAIRRTISALRVCANKLKWWGVKRSRLIATEACRTAINGHDFIERVRQEVGLSLEIIDRETEAELAVGGAAPLIAEWAERILVFDIGGGSTELMWLQRHGDGFQNVGWTSIPAGVVTLSEQFGGRDVSLEAFQRMRGQVRPLLESFAEEVQFKTGGTELPSHLLGTSGTVTTIAGVHARLQRYDRSRVDGSWLKAGDIGRVTRELLAMDFEQRAASPCIGRHRADLVLAGCAILEEIRHIWPVKRTRVADRGLREGILTKLMQEDGVYGTG